MYAKHSRTSWCEVVRPEDLLAATARLARRSLRASNSCVHRLAPSEKEGSHGAQKISELLLAVWVLRNSPQMSPQIPTAVSLHNHSRRPSRPGHSSGCPSTSAEGRGARPAPPSPYIAQTAPWLVQTIYLGVRQVSAFTAASLYDSTCHAAHYTRGPKQTFIAC